mmetsp:Transcript_7156/g.10902  ORF Transcript_7156/g.10902 Transcript_7156/m.10902 type:complete len:593 (+) Transcript_7156:1294-3072(+)|eukprot:CAMPEP_0167755292 /NCGR_PEP_ID=MMETSP0110_2-20121227/8741_1 /TAXON_ID=629695 /ORGANISM="Gymnochlora sp., Strain CCMP2014" /LENGTH=592 /DNA_ID=CAMNT_0007641259 /DNA_START=1214 /DNA_END=2992 /DNA_ORIENTATION=+
MVLIVALLYFVSPTASTGVYQTSSGPITGTRASLLLPQPVEAFEGIPFAAPPVGNLRFRAPQPGPTWENVREMSKPGSPCPQIRIVGSAMLGSEDCLYMNVYKPAKATNTSALPIFFWVYGGGYVIGDGYEFGLYDGRRLAATHNQIVVTMNYRLIGLGFMALEELQSEDPDNSTGNYALQDQRAALKWIRKNARVFGGDPDKITLAGESAGAFSVMWHLVSERSQGLFSRAILESGTNEVSWFFQPLEDATKFYGNFSAILGCNDTTTRLQCLRKLPAEDLVISVYEYALDMMGRDIPMIPIPNSIPAYGSALYPVMPVGPTIDGSPAGLLDVPIHLVANNKANMVPILFGANKRSGNLLLEALLPFMVPGTSLPADDTTVRLAMEWFVGPNATSTLESLYTKEEYKDAILKDTQRVADALRDCMFRCPDRRLARLWSDAGEPTFLYTFSFNLGPIDKIVDGSDFHTSELPFVWKNYLPELLLLGVPEPWYASNVVTCLWARFVHCGDPNLEGCSDIAKVPGCDDLPSGLKWPQFNDPNYPRGVYLSLQKHPVAVELQEDNKYPNNEFPSDKKCDFWDNTTVLWKNLRVKG